MQTEGDWIWTIELDSLLDRHAHLETEDGMLREGRITAIRTRTITLAGETIEVPVAVELNGDPRDLVEFLRLKSVDIQ